MERVHSAPHSSGLRGMDQPSTSRTIAIASALAANHGLVEVVFGVDVQRYGLHETAR